MKVEVLISDISNLATKTKQSEQGLITTIQFDAKIKPALVARILNLQRQGAPLLISVGSPQATMDLDITEYGAHPAAEGKEPEHTSQML